MEISYYSYKELRAAAESGKPEDLNALGEWLERFGRMYWNGEYFDADGIRLFPVSREIVNPDDPEDIEYETIGYTDSSRDEDRFIPAEANR